MSQMLIMNSPSFQLMDIEISSLMRKHYLLWLYAYVSP